MQALEAASFWWESSIGMVIPLWEFIETVTVAETSYQMLRVFIILQLGEGLKSFNKHKCANFSGEKKDSEAFWDVYF